MRVAALAVVALTVIASGCTSTYSQSTLAQPTGKLAKEKSVVVATPADGFYESKQYSGSGRMTAQAVSAAFANFSAATTVVPECQNLACLQEGKYSSFDYYVIPEILHWEDRNTEWSGKKDKLEVKVSIYEGGSWKELASTVISGKSKWATFGGDHPQDLLPEPLKEYIESLY
jgi:hypothetical protein